MKRIRFTKEGFKKLKEEYENLLSQRKPAVDELKRAREMGDLSENGLYRAARSRLSSLDSRLSRVSSFLKRAEVIETAGDKIGIGSTVILTDGKKEFTYMLVGDLEAEPLKGKISLFSPIGRGIAGRYEGENVEIETPGGIIIYKIKKIVKD